MQLLRRVVVGPADPVAVEHVEDGPRRIVEQLRDLVGRQPVRGAGDQEAPVGDGRPQARSEPAVRQGKGPGEGGIERQVVFGPVAHGHLGVPLQAGALDAGDEAVVAATVELLLAGNPGLGGYVGVLRG